MSLIYSPAIATRLKKMTTKLHGRATSVEVRQARIIVHFADGYKEGVLKTLFLEEFAKSRREEALSLKPEQVAGTTWLVEGYGVNMANVPQCSCSDYADQSQIGIKTPCCRHVYAVLNQLGYTRLSNYLEAKKPQLPKLPKWELRWETATGDRRSVTRLNYKPSCFELLEMRRCAHSKGFHLKEIEKIN